MPITKSAHFQQVRSWLNEINRDKQAAAKSKSAKAHSEPGGYMGETTHPSKDVDDNLEDAHEGARSAENERDVKEQQMAGNVDSTSGYGKTQEDLNYNIGVHQSATGEDPSVEDDYRSSIKDPGTSHPAAVDKVGPKYGAWVSKEAGELGDLANEILADVFNQVAPKSVGKPSEKAAQSSKTGTVSNVQAAQAGYELAAKLGLDKQAADSQAYSVIADTIKQAQFGADRVGAFLVSYIKESEALMRKQAGPEMDPAALAAMAGGAGAGGPEGGGDPAAMMGGGGGGMPPEAGGGDPAAMMGGAPGGEGGGAGGGDALQELAMALMELGISPEQLAAAAQGGAGGGAGGEAPPMDPAAMGGAMGGGAGGPPPEDPAAMGQKLASAVKKYQRSGKFKFSEAKTANQKKIRTEMKQYVMEIIGAAGGLR